MLKRLKFLLMGLALFLSPPLLANEEIRHFIATMNVKTYDCPSTEVLDDIESYLSTPDLQNELKVQLQVKQAQGMICSGEYDAAFEQLNGLVNNPALDKETEAYASAIYQIGFIYDVKEDAQRCEYYQQAEKLSSERFNDIYLSSQMGQITVCDPDKNEGIKLGRMYALLELYMVKGDKPAIAHIHNNIGLLYAQLGQQVLAGEQFLKSYEMGLDEYEGTNLLATLISAITAQMASGNFDGAKQSIEEFKRVNNDVNTPLTNVWLHFAEAGYYYRTNDFDGLRDSLSKWSVFLPKVENYQFTGFHRWYSAALCLHERNKPCLERFLVLEKQERPAYRSLVLRNKDYLKLQVEILLFLGDVPKAQERFEQFSEMMLQKAMKQQASGKVLGVAQLHGQIHSLETSLLEAEEKRIWSIAKLALLFVVLLIILVVLVRRKYITHLSSDPLTGLRNTRSAIDMIKRVDKPEAGKTNAIALFDLDNFKEVNAQFGHITADIALKRVAGTLQSATRAQDIVGRLASEQFIVCLINIEEGTATKFFERIRQALENTILSAQGEDKVSIHSSMSIYVSTEGFSDLDDVLVDMQKSLDKSFRPVQSLG